MCQSREKRQFKHTRRRLGAKQGALCSPVCPGLSMGQCVFSSSGRREDDKALCAVPTPESCWQLCYSLPSSLSPPANNVLLIALFQLAAKAWRNWIMKWSCGKKKKNKTERQFSRKAAKDTSRFHFLWHMQKSKHQPPSAAACTSLAQICTPLLSPPKSGSLHTTTVPQGSESSSLREESSCGAQIKRAFAFSSCASAPWEEIHANTQQRLIPSSILATLPEACL